MKNKRQIITLGAVFGALLVYVLLTQTGNRGFNTLKLPNLPKIKSEDIQKVSVIKADSRMVLQKTAKGWQIAEPITFAADAGKINAMLRLCDELRITNWVTDRAEVAADYGLNSTTAMTLVLEIKGGKKVELVVGKTDATATHSFVRMPNDQKIYQVLGDVGQVFSRPVAEWRSLGVFDFSTDQVKQWTIDQKGKTPLVVGKEQEVEPKLVADTPQGVTPASLPTRMIWKAQGYSAPLRDPNVNEFLNGFCRLMAQQILDNQLWTKEPIARVEVVTQDQTQYTLEVLAYQAAGKQYWVRRSGEQTVYVLQEFQGRNLLKSLKDFQ